MPAEIYEIVALAARFWFLFLMALIVWRSYRWYARERAERKKRLRYLPDAGYIGEFVVIRSAGGLEEGAVLSVPFEGTLGFVRSNDLCVPVAGVAKRHLWFSYDQRYGLIMTPFGRNEFTVDQKTVAENPGGLCMCHGSRLYIGECQLRLRMFAGYEVGWVMDPPAPEPQAMQQPEWNDPEAAPFAMDPYNAFVPGQPYGTAQPTGGYAQGITPNGFARWPQPDEEMEPGWDDEDWEEEWEEDREENREKNWQEEEMEQPQRPAQAAWEPAMEQKQERSVYARPEAERLLAAAATAGMEDETGVAGNDRNTPTFTAYAPEQEEAEPLEFHPLLEDDDWNDWDDWNDDAARPVVSESNGHSDQRERSYVKADQQRKAAAHAAPAQPVRPVAEPSMPKTADKPVQQMVQPARKPAAQGTHLHTAPMQVPPKRTLSPHLQTAPLKMPPKQYVAKPAQEKPFEIERPAAKAELHRPDVWRSKQSLSNIPDEDSADAFTTPQPVQTGSQQTVEGGDAL